jgi:hypothetical protein
MDMSLFSDILTKIFGKKDADTPLTPGAPPAPSAAPGADTAPPVTPEAPPPAVDVAALLDAKPGAGALNWRTSIVDLLKVLGMNSDLEHRKALADELGYTGAKDGSVEMNTWLHKEVIKKIKGNGGIVPSDLTD